MYLKKGDTVVVISGSYKPVNGKYTTGEVLQVLPNSSRVVLKAYSLDYFLTIDKFCQAFTAKTLVDDIIKPSLQQSQSKHFDKFREIQTGSKSGGENRKLVFGCPAERSWKGSTRLPRRFRSS